MFVVKPSLSRLFHIPSRKSRVICHIRDELHSLGQLFTWKFLYFTTLFKRL